MWAFDEHRIGLKPILRRVWAKRGQRPVAVVHPRYQWRYLHGFVEPPIGRTFWWITSWVDAHAFTLVLHEFAAWLQEQSPGSPLKVLLVVDQAGWHTGEVTVPPGITLGHHAAVSAALFARTPTRRTLVAPLQRTTVQSLPPLDSGIRRPPVSPLL